MNERRPACQAVLPPDAWPHHSSAAISSSVGGIGQSSPIGGPNRMVFQALCKRDFNRPREPGHRHRGVAIEAAARVISRRAARPASLPLLPIGATSRSLATRFLARSARRLELRLQLGKLLRTSKAFWNRSVSPLARQRLVSLVGSFGSFGPWSVTGGGSTWTIVESTLAGVSPNGRLLG